ncbi:MULTISPECIES: EAL domain-containing protein [unclassified Agarivorans]|uniref:EAL domain-containing protein n=1 Tax=unclassified Agarivorans TaxID=2636026 RepID=UPI003D7E433A
MQLSTYISSRTFIWISNFFGLAFICLLAYQNVENEGMAHSAAIYQQLNSMTKDMNNFYEYSFKDMQMPKDCPLFKARAENAVLSSSNIRSISWVNQRQIQCSTLPNYQDIKLSNNNHAAQSKRMFFVPSTIFDVYDQEQEKGEVLIAIPVSGSNFIDFGIHPKHIKEMLENVEGNFNSYLRINDYIFSHTSVVKVEDFNTLPQASYGNDLFQVYYQYSLKTYVHYVFNKFGLMIALWLVICNIGARAVYKYIDAFNWLSFSIARAICYKQFTAYLQPVIDASGKLNGAEVLVRWQHPTKGLILPADFVSIAEKSGQISAISSLLFEQVTTALNNIPVAKRKPLHIAFNICPVQLTEPAFFVECERFIKNFAEDGHTLIIEITEREELPNDMLYFTAIDKLKLIGVKIALDDFGTGHCSLKYLHQIDTDYLKIDRSFVQAIHDTHKIKLLENIIDLAQRLKVQTIAEGIEQQSELDYLLSRGVNAYQGYYFDKPLPLVEFMKKYT